MAHALRLPPELLLRVLDETDPTPMSLLLGPARVCSQWRSLARSHPVYCKHIHVTRTTSKNYQLFVDRLEAGLPHNSGVHIDIDDIVTRLAPLLPHITRHMDRVISLKISYYASSPDRLAIMDALSECAAPQLRWLRLRLLKGGHPDPTSESSPLVSLNLLCGNAPSLQRLELCGMTCWLIPPDKPIPAFGAVRDLSLNYTETACASLYHVLASTPLVRRLELLNDHSQPQPVNAPLLQSLNLDYLFVSNVSDAWVETFAALDVTRIPEVAGDAVERKLEHMSQSIFVPYVKACLQGPLALSCVKTTPHTELVLHAPANDSTLRVVRGLFSYRQNVFQIVSLPGFDANRIVHIELCTSIWYGLRTVAPVFPNAATLVLFLDIYWLKDDPVWAGGVWTCVHCPSLGSITLRLCPGVRQTLRCIDAELAGCLLRRHVVVEERPTLHVYPPLMLVGNRKTLLAVVGSIVEPRVDKKPSVRVLPRHT